MRSKSLYMILAYLLALLPLTGCADLKPWEHAAFGTYQMRSDRDPLNDSLRDHVYFTREAAAGGRGVGGGGCGCN